MKKGYLFYIFGVTLIYSFFVLFSVTSYSETASLENQIIGKWVAESEVSNEDGNFESYFEFLKDGTVINNGKGFGSKVGNFKFIDDNRLRVDWPSKSEVFGISIDKGGLLTLKDPTGKVLQLITETEQKKRVAEIKLRFTDYFPLHGEGVVVDNQTELMWTKDANLPVGPLNWDQAMSYVARMNAGAYPNYGYKDWRLPTNEELESLTSVTEGYLYTIFTSLFTNIQDNDYWSSTSNANNPKYAWIFTMRNGVKSIGYKSSALHYVWPVRSIQ